jgi:hypothetical protein
MLGALKPIWHFSFQLPKRGGGSLNTRGGHRRWENWATTEKDNQQANKDTRSSTVSTRDNNKNYHRQIQPKINTNTKHPTALARQPKIDKKNIRKYNRPWLEILLRTEVIKVSFVTNLKSKGQVANIIIFYYLKFDVISQKLELHQYKPKRQLLFTNRLQMSNERQWRPINSLWNTQL